MVKVLAYQTSDEIFCFVWDVWEVLVGKAKVAAQDVARRLVVGIVQEWRQAAEKQNNWNLVSFVQDSRGEGMRGEASRGAFKQKKV